MHFIWAYTIAYIPYPNTIVYCIQTGRIIHTKRVETRCVQLIYHAHEEEAHKHGDDRVEWSLHPQTWRAAHDRPAQAISSQHYHALFLILMWPAPISGIHATRPPTTCCHDHSISLILIARSIIFIYMFDFS